MAKLHRLTVNGCPFDIRLGRRLAWARERMERGEVDAEDFDDERRGVPVARLYAELLDMAPEREELVCTHGDFCDANVLIDPDSLDVTRIVDWGRAGVSDRYQDIALMLRDLESQLHAPFWEAYGAGAPLDLARVAYYQALDEFF